MNSVACHRTLATGLYMGKGQEWPTCATPERCQAQNACFWRRFHGLDEPGFEHKYLKLQVPA